MDISLIPLWTWGALCIAAGGLSGAVLASGARLRLSNDLLGEQQRLRLVQTKSEHQHFGVTDLKLRIRHSQTSSDLLTAELEQLRTTYAELDTKLQDCWNNEVILKTAVAEQQAREQQLAGELAEWKERLNNLQLALDKGEITETELKRELTAGITTVCEHSGGEMTAVQQLLLDCGESLTATADSQDSEKVIGLLGAKIELLEGQLRYWQNLATEQQAALAMSTPTAADQPDADSQGSTAEQSKAEASNGKKSRGKKKARASKMAKRKIAADSPKAEKTKRSNVIQVPRQASPRSG